MSNRPSIGARMLGMTEIALFYKTRREGALKSDLRLGCQLTLTPLQYFDPSHQQTLHLQTALAAGTCAEKGRGIADGPYIISLII